jgi:hypothetical protein
MFRNLVQLSLLIKVPELFLKCPNLVLVFKWKLWCSLTRWLAYEWYLDLLSIRLVEVERWGKTASSCRAVRAVFSRWQMWCSSAAALFGQLLPQPSGEIQFWMLPSVVEIGSRIHLLPCFGRLVSLSYPLCLFQYLLGAGGSSRWLVCQPTFALSLCCVMACLRVQHWKLSSLLHPWQFSNVSPPFSMVGSVSLHPILVLDYSSLFMAFSFARGGHLSAQGLCWVIFPRCRGVRKPCMVPDAHLFLLHIHTGSIGASYWGEMLSFGMV